MSAGLDYLPAEDSFLEPDRAGAADPRETACLPPARLRIVPGPTAGVHSNAVRPRPADMWARY